jgi:5-methylcytosine-specific restriction endonuclease McrA
VLGMARSNKKHKRARCLCSCGKRVTVICYRLANGTTRSCGCCAAAFAAKTRALTVRTVRKIPKGDGRQMPEYKDFRIKVLQRDKYTCLVTGSRQNLEVHHLFGYVNNEAGRNDIHNAVTLCKSVHTAFHMYQGGFCATVTPVDFILWAVKQGVELQALVDFWVDNDLVLEANGVKVLPFAQRIENCKTVFACERKT